MKKIETLKKWLSVAASEVEGNEPRCPSCAETSIDYQYVGNVSSHLGYLDVWCTACNTGVHVSRVVVPEKSGMLPLDTPDEILLERIPDFKNVF